MAVITFAFLFLIRVLIPIAILLVIGEWTRRRDIRYWLNN